MQTVQGTAKAVCDVVVDRCDAGTGAGKLIIYTGTEPSYADDTAGTEVATCTLPDPAFGTATYDSTNHWAEADLSSNAEDSSATGNASAVTYFRLTDSDSAVVLQGTVGTSGCDLNLNSTTIGAGVTVTVTALQVRVPLNQPKGGDMKYKIWDGKEELVTPIGEVLSPRRLLSDTRLQANRG